MLVRIPFWIAASLKIVWKLMSVNWVGWSEPVQNLETATRTSPMIGSAVATIP